jgi:hypothetical protein
MLSSYMRKIRKYYAEEYSKPPGQLIGTRRDLGFHFLGGNELTKSVAVIDFTFKNINGNDRSQQCGIMHGAAPRSNRQDQ